MQKKTRQVCSLQLKWHDKSALILFSFTYQISTLWAVTYPQENTQHSKTIWMTSSLLEGIVFGWIPVYNVKLSWKWLPIDCVFTSATIGASKQIFLISFISL